MTKSCNIRDVARLAGVATSTVSRVLNEHDAARHTAEETRQRIWDVARQLNYVPNINAKRLFGHRSSVIALVIPSHERHGKHVFDDQHLIRIFSGIETALSGSGYRLLIVFNDDSFVKHQEYLSLFLQGAVDGMLVWGAYADQSFWNELYKEKHPVVMLSRSNLHMDHFSYVLHDYQSGCKAILSHLLAGGHRQIAWLCGPRDNGTVQDMSRGFASLPTDVTLSTHYGNFSRESGQKLTLEALAAHPDLTALIVVNSDMAAGAEAACRQKNRSIDIVVCDTASTLECPKLAHLSVNDLLLGREAVKCLMKQMEGDASPIQKTLPVHLHLPQPNA